MKAWLPVPFDSDFSIHNLPFGVFSFRKSFQSNESHSQVTSVPVVPRRCGTILGDTVIDLSVLEEAGLFDNDKIPGLCANVFHQSTLNVFLEQHTKPVWLAFRCQLQSLLRDGGTDERLRKNPQLQKAAFHNVNSVQLHMPITIGDYTDFYASRDHATNVGVMFRGKDNALNPNWLHLPVGYHGRASTVFVSGHDVRRPCGQILAPGASVPHYGPTQQLDFELEVAAVIGGPANATPLTMAQAKDRFFGLMLLNDWSARDIQKWEYVPLGPFNAKNFATTVSPWIVMVEAFNNTKSESVKGQQIDSDTTLLPYLRDPDYASSLYNIELTVDIQSASAQAVPVTVSRSNFWHLYWNVPQQIVHHTVTGCVLKAGDLLGSGTISGPTDDSMGSLLEMSWNSTRTVSIGQDEVRTFLEDGDTVVLRGICKHSDIDENRVGFGECRGTILQAVPFIEEGGTQSSSNKDTKPSPNVTHNYEFTLFSYGTSLVASIVQIAFSAKKIAYRMVQKTTTTCQTNDPLILLRCNDCVTGKRITLSQPLVIFDFLDQNFPQCISLIPRDPYDRAIALEIVEVIQSGIWLNSKDQHFIDNQNTELCLTNVEVLVQNQRNQSDGPYSMGSFSPTIVDAFIVPLMYRARQLRVDLTVLCPTLVNIDALCTQHEWFQISPPGND